MKNLFNRMVVGQTRMLHTRKDQIIVGCLFTGSLLLCVIGYLIKQPIVASWGISLAVIDLTIAYMMGKKIKLKKPPVDLYKIINE